MGCLACELSSGKRELPGGRVHATSYWVVEHCVGPLGVGTLLVKPLRHCLHVAELGEEEAQELGPLLRRVSACVQELCEAEQVYVCMWSHADWEPGHLHFVVQPVTQGARAAFERPGPFLQVEMFLAGDPLEASEVGAFCDRARDWFTRTR